MVGKGSGKEDGRTGTARERCKQIEMEKEIEGERPTTQRYKANIHKKESIALYSDV